MGVRRRGRELALQLLYQRELAGGEVDALASSSTELQEAPVTAREFANELLRGTLGHLEEIDRELAGQADHWRLERMAAVDRNILRLAMFELLYETDTPVGVIIDEAIELAKRYGSEHSSQFVNGVLDAFARRVRLVAEGA